MKHIISIIIAAVMAASAFGRDIKGTILDETNVPLDFVNVVLYCDSNLVAGTITDGDGKFSISVDSDCALTAKVSFVGYETYEQAVPTTDDMGVITLTPSAVQLGEVVVKATRPATTMKGNALVTNVEGSSLALAGTANDVLVHVPMVVDNGGTLEVFGKGAPAIYLNGRKVNDLQELSQLNSQDIKNVEVITNPGAAYAADVKSVIRIRTKPPKGDGWSGTLRTDNGFQHYFRTGNSIDLKYRTRGLEIFANYGWWYGDNRFDRLNDMATTTARGSYLQSVRTIGKESYNDMTGKLGFSWLINDRHSIGAYYQNSWNRHTTNGSIPSEVWQDGSLLDRYSSEVYNKATALPRHYANLYYNGSVGKLGIDFNANYLWYKSRETSFSAEIAEQGDDRDVNNFTTNRNRMFAEKLVFSYPLGKGGIEIGEEYTNSRSSNLFTTNLSEIGNADNRVDESNIAAFVEFGQQIGRFNIGVGLRYEHVKFDYYEMGQLRDEQSKTYNNLFPRAECRDSNRLCSDGSELLRQDRAPRLQPARRNNLLHQPLDIRNRKPLSETHQDADRGIHGTMAPIFRSAFLYIFQRWRVSYYRALRSRRRGHTHQDSESAQPPLLPGICRWQLSGWCMAAKSQCRHDETMAHSACQWGANGDEYSNVYVPVAKRHPPAA